MTGKNQDTHRQLKELEEEIAGRFQDLQEIVEWADQAGLVCNLDAEVPPALVVSHPCCDRRTFIVEGYLGESDEASRWHVIEVAEGANGWYNDRLDGAHLGPMLKRLIHEYSAPLLFEGHLVEQRLTNEINQLRAVQALVEEVNCYASRENLPLQVVVAPVPNPPTSYGTTWTVHLALGLRQVWIHVGYVKWEPQYRVGHNRDLVYLKAYEAAAVAIAALTSEKEDA